MRPKHLRVGVEVDDGVMARGIDVAIAALQHAVVVDAVGAGAGEDPIGARGTHSTMWAACHLSSLAIDREALARARHRVASVGRRPHQHRGHVEFGV